MTMTKLPILSHLSMKKRKNNGFYFSYKQYEKLAEMQRILSPLGINVVTAKMLGIQLPDVVEDGDTFEANAKIKALSACKITNMPAIADDSGLCVDYLGGAPGIYSARFANIVEHNGVNIDNEKNADDEKTTICCLKNFRVFPMKSARRIMFAPFAVFFPTAEKSPSAGSATAKSAISATATRASAMTRCL